MIKKMNKYMILLKKYNGIKTNLSQCAFSSLSWRFSYYMVIMYK